MLEQLSSITVIAIAVLGIAIVFYRNDFVYNCFITILVVNVMTEVALYAAILNESDIPPIYNAYIVIHQSLWLFLLVELLKKKTMEYLLLLPFLLFAIINAVWLEPETTYYLTWILSVILYVIYFGIKNYRLIIKEQLGHFTSSIFTLLSAPLLFFFAVGFVFAFRESAIGNYQINEIYLFDILVKTGNYFYYALLILFIYLNRKRDTLDE